jgi:GntR family transcriptional regulator/MocR family aminotransferase
VLSPALRIGFVVADSELISAARALRSLQARQPPANNQRAAALFISLGHYDSTMRRLARVFAERRTALLDALNHYLRSSLVVAPVRGGTTCWVRGPDHLDVNFLAAQAAQHGILIEPVAHYFAGAEAPHNVFRLGVTSLPVERIRDGVARLEALMRNLSRDAVEHLEGTRGRRLGAGDLARTIAGATLLSRTVYGDPCTVEIREDGHLVGRAGFQDEDCDEGEWWVEEGLFCRRWRSWCYGEVGRYIPVIDGPQIKWFNPEGRLVDAVAIHLRA